jgi:hypothetical protein
MRLPEKVGTQQADSRAGWKDVTMGAIRRKFTLEFRIEAAHRELDIKVQDSIHELKRIQHSLNGLPRQTLVI